VDFGLFGLLDFAVDLVVAVIPLGAHEVGAQFPHEGLGVVHQRGFLADGQDAHLLGGEPEREVAGVMLDEEPDEALMRAERRAVDAQRGLLGVVPVAIDQAEALGHGEVHLVGGQGELTANDAPDLDVNFGAVEGGFVGHLDVVDAGVFEHVAHHVLGLKPQFRFVDVFAAQAFPAVGAEAHEVFLNAEDFEVFEVHLVDGIEFLRELLGGAVDMRVVHVHRAHAHEAEQFPGLLVAVAAAVFGQAQRQVAVAARHRRKDAVVMRAVHGLEVVAGAQRAKLFRQGVDFLVIFPVGGRPLRARGRLPVPAGGGLLERFQLRFEVALSGVLLFFEQFHGREHAFGIVGQVAGGEIHFLFGNVRRFGAHVAGQELGFLGQFLQFLEDGRAFGQPERQAGAGVFGVNGIKAHLGAELAVVAAPGFLQHLKIRVELGLGFEGGAVDALELGVFLVALVVGAGDGGELEGADIAGAHDVRAGAQVYEIAGFVVADGFVGGDFGQVAELELAGVARALAQAAQPAALGVLDGLLAGDDDLLEAMVGFDLFLHFGFDGGEVLRGDAMRQVHVVIEAIFDRRPRGELGFRPQAQNGGGHDMGAGMAQPFQVGHLVAVIERFAFVLHGSYLSTKG